MWITLSREVCPEIREYERFSTTCANAYVQPVMAGYLEPPAGALRGDGHRAARVYLMTSGGGAVHARRWVRRSRCAWSNRVRPAARSSPRTVAESCGADRVLSFDMGGTTAKICLIDDYEPEISRSFEFGRMYRFLKGSGLPIRIPVIEMVEIGAGGGSIARVDHSSASGRPGQRGLRAGSRVLRPRRRRSRP